ncbi:hypothetical protein L227DRAFT_541117 [Lentinus tigrinus ALCF2SS1-6]|uniref:Uncharacterized protein n=1 Tax=Lentinus tigrinus ALCF2SS1-6 TaxID=1328759 RepID=A0A5C2SLZ8_9APHY|nr:hypothetical protein L227DRAFT_541117 [Lentinus tigrinus ALCF2SS1-6]
MEASSRKQARSKSFLTRKASKKHPEDRNAKHKGQYSARSASLEVQEKEQDTARPLFNPFAISIIPDPLNELPTWYHREVESATASAAQFRVKYPLHNPSGPRWYRNHHLLPPTRDGRPPSVFSPSFPPMASAPERAQDPSRMAGPSRTPSGSPLPTPSSSQIRIQEPFKPRSRKVSQNTHDNVDISDGADPYSPISLSHSPSPYDEKSPMSPGPTGPNYYNNRARRASMNHGTRHRTMAPSPLSQSTSAVHLHVLDPAQIQLPRKLSKRRKPFNGLFGAHQDPLRRQSTVGPSMTSLPSLQASSMQKPKRGSILGRLVKRFSVLRKPERSVVQNGYGTEWAHVGGNLQPSPAHTPTSPQSPEPHQRASSHLSKSPEPPRRVPAPSIEAVQRESFDHANHDTASHRSVDTASVHEIQTSGRLTITNPDDPNSSDDTPVEAPASLPPTTYVYEEVSPVHQFKEELPLPDIPRTDSPMQMDSVRPRFSVQLSDPPVRPPAPPSSPPLPELPPPTPTPMLQTVIEAEYSSAASTIGPPSSPPHLQNALAKSASPASTVTPLPPPEDVALARASLFVNPPTPYAAPLMIPPTASVPQDSPQSPSKRVDRSPTKSKDGASRSKSTRQTETFKLVRSPSGTIKQATEVIMGMGEQWEIVETPAEALAPKKSKLTKDKEKARTKSPEREPVHREESRRRREHSSSAEESDPRHKRHPSTSGREKAPSINSVRSTQTPIAPRRSTKKTGDVEDSRASKRASSSTSTGATLAQQQTRERHLSASATTRPNSELHSAADLSSVKAKDAWEMERLWKARSMAYGPDGMPMVSTPATIGSDSRPSTFISTELQRIHSIPSVAAVAEMQKASNIPLAAAAAQQMHGSSHTYVVYQGAEGHASYAQFASPPPQNPMASPAQQYYRHSGYGSPDAHPLANNPLPNPPRLSAYQRSPLPMSLANPLPEPPRLSSYQPAPLPASLADAAGDGSRNSWTQYGGMTNSTH